MSRTRTIWIALIVVSVLAGGSLIAMKMGDNLKAEGPKGGKGERVEVAGMSDSEPRTSNLEPPTSTIPLSGKEGSRIKGTGEHIQAEVSKAKTLTIGASPSLRSTLQWIVPMFEREYSVKVHVLYSPSQTLRRQIETGEPINKEPIDVVLPGPAQEIEYLHRMGLTLNGGPQIYAQSQLVLVVSTGSSAAEISLYDYDGLSNLLMNRGIRLAVANQQTSAMGRVTERGLRSLAPVSKERVNLLYAQHAGEVLDLVRAGKADAGLVYRVDAINGQGVWIIDDNPFRTSAPLRFGAAVVSTARETSRPVAEQFVHFLTSRRIQKLLLHFGFSPVPL